MHSDEVLGNWIPLVDYSFKTGTSLSTLRRHIKSNKILYRLEEGRYLIYDPEASATRLTTQVSTDATPLHSAAQKQIHVLETDQISIGIDTPEDLHIIENKIKSGEIKIS